MRILSVLLITVIVGVMLYLLHLQLGFPPDPRLGGCDPANIAASETRELVMMRSWLFSREFFGAIVAASAVFLLYYRQVFHALPALLAWSARFSVIGAISLVCGAFVRTLAETWVATNPETCLAEALGTRSHEIAISARALPLSWSWGVFVDAIACAFAGAMIGHFIYLLARRLRA